MSVAKIKSAEPPHNLEAERALLGAMLVSAEAARAGVQAIPSSEDYYSPKHRLIHRAIARLVTQDRPADVVTVLAEVTSMPVLGVKPEVTGPDLVELAAGMGSTKSVAEYADIVAKTAAARRQMHVARELLDALATGDEDRAARMRLELSSEYSSRIGGPQPWELVDLGPILDSDRPEIVPTVFERADGVALLYPGRTHVFMGEAESMKSWAVAVVLAQELKRGNHVMLIDLEDEPQIWVEKLTALGVSAEAIRDRFSYIRPTGGFDAMTRMVIAGAIELRGSPTVAAIDAVTGAMGVAGLDPDKGPEVDRFYAGCPRFLAGTGAAVIMIDHVTKDRDGRGRWAIGSERKISGLTGAAFAFDVEKPFGHEKTGLARITVSKDRAGRVRQHEGANRVVAKLELASWPDGGVTAAVLVPEPSAAEGTFRPTGLMEKLSKAIEETPGLTTKAARATVSGKSEYKDLALELLIAEGYVAMEEGANRRHEHRSVRPFRVSEERRDDADA